MIDIEEDEKNALFCRSWRWTICSDSKKRTQQKVSHWVDRSISFPTIRESKRCRKFWCSVSFFSVSFQIVFSRKFFTRKTSLRFSVQFSSGSDVARKLFNDLLKNYDERVKMILEVFFRHFVFLENCFFFVRFGQFWMLRARSMSQSVWFFLNWSMWSVEIIFEPFSSRFRYVRRFVEDEKNQIITTNVWLRHVRKYSNKRTRWRVSTRSYSKIWS